MSSNETHDFIVRGYECGPDEMATLPNVINYLQEAAGRQALAAGMARQNFEAQGLDISWVLTRMYVQLTRYPRWEETVRITTWPAGGRKIVVERDFIICVGDEIIGRATSEWVMINLTTRKLAPIPQYVFDSVDPARERSLPNHTFSHLKWTCQTISTAAPRFTTRRSDIDINNHVNNVHYVEWIVEAVPTEFGKIGSLEIVYKSETLLGEEIIAETVETAPGVICARVASSGGVAHVLAELKRL